MKTEAILIFVLSFTVNYSAIYIYILGEGVILGGHCLRP